VNRYDFAKLIVGGCISVMFAALVFGPMGGGRRYTDQLQRRVQTELDAGKLERVKATVEYDPVLRRSVILSGPVEVRDRRTALAIVRGVAGVADARWAEEKAVSGMAPGRLPTRYGQQSY
jgi:hypothetical protein